MPPTVGQRLKQAREERYLTIEKASEQTRIRAVFLRALEADDYSVMPSAAQGRGFLRNYADFLSIDIDEVIAELQRHAPLPEQISGPLSEIKEAEMDVPPLTDNATEKSKPRFWTSWIARLRKPPPREEADTSEVVKAAEDEDGEAVAELQAGDRSLGHDQIEAEDRPNQALWERFKSLFKLRIVRPASFFDSRFSSQESIESSNEDVTARHESAQVIFTEIGVKLREHREMLSLTIEEVERHTHMRAAYIHSLEQGHVDELPSPVQTRGMLANYAAFMDLDADSILLRFADAIQARHREKYTETPRELIQTEVKTSLPLLRSFIAGDLIFGLVMIALILALSVWGISQALSSGRQENVDATAPSIVDILAGTPQTAPAQQETFVPAEDAPLATNAFGLNTLEAPTFAANVNVVISVFAVERTYLRVRVDGEVAFEGRLPPRETLQFEAEDQVEVLTGNGAALRVSYNGRDLGLMGNIGEVVDRVYTVSGVVTPTSTVPPTPTETRPVTPTPTSTVTPTPTPAEDITP